MEKLKNLRRKFNYYLSTYFLQYVMRFMYTVIYKNVADKDKVMWIDPNKDVWGMYTGGFWYRINFEGLISYEDWSGLMSPFEEIYEDKPKWKSMKEYFVDGKDWLETALFTEEYHRRYSKEKVLQLKDDYLVKYDKLFNKLKEHGFQEATKDNKISPLYVCIGPEGQLLWTAEGNHRFGMAMILERKIPVKVLKRHKDWQKVREQIFKGNKEATEKYKNHIDIYSDTKIA